MTVLHRLPSYLRLPFLPIILSPLVIFSPILFNGKALFWGTPGLQFIPWWTWAWETLLSGHLPLWNPMLGMGAPLLANYQSALFYPPNWVYFSLYVLGDIGLMAWGQALMVVLHLIWSGIGMIYLARRLGLSILGQTVSSLAFSMSGYLVARAGFLSINSAVAWIPWVMLVTLNAVTSTRRGKSVVKLGLIIGFQLLAGHAQTTWYTLLLSGLWAGFWSFRQISKKSSIPNLSLSLKTLFSGWVILLAGLMIGISFSAIQLFPTAEYLLKSHRASAVDYDFAMTYSFWPWRFLNFVAPELFGNPAYGDYWGYANYWEDAVYIGLLPFLLGLSVIFWSIWKILIKRGSHDGGPVDGEMTSNELADITNPYLSMFLFGVILVSFLLALGKNTAIFPWLYENIPTFNMFQAPSRFTIWAEFSFALLAGIGANRWRRPVGRGLYWTRLGTMGAFAITLGSGLGWFFLDDVRSTFIRATALTGFWALGAGFLALTAPENESLALNHDIDDEKKTDRWSLWEWIVVIWVMADLLVAHWGLNPGVDVEFYRQPSPIARSVRSLLDGGRLYIPPDDEYSIKFERFLQFDSFLSDESWQNMRAVLLPNLNILEGIPSVNNFDPLVPGRYATWMGELSEVDRSTREQMLDIMGVKVVEREAQDIEYGVIFDLQDSGSRLRWVECSFTVVDSEQALEQMLSGTIDFESTVIIERDQAATDKDCDGVERPVLFEMYSVGPNSIVVNIKVNQLGWLVLSDTYYPGWTVRLDGESVDMIRANYLFRAVNIPPGEHVVQMDYRPKSLYLGIGISLITLIGLIGFMMKK